MTRHALMVRGAAALALLGAVAGCNNDKKDVLTAPVPAGGKLVQSYVALGNSITAGYQSGGIDDSTQMESYAYLLAQQMGTRFAIPALADPGCPPPIDNFLTGHRVGNGTSSTCAYRDPASITPVINNVAVPGATSLDPTAASTSASNILTTLFLGGQTQVQKALEAQPTFATIWIGNNDVLPAALSGFLVPVKGVSPGMTSVTTFTKNYATMMSQLMQGAPALKGVLIGVVNVTGAPALFPVQQLIDSAGFKLQFDVAATGVPGGVTIDSTCVNRPTSLVYVGIIQAMQAGAYPTTLYCKLSSNATLAKKGVGESYVLDPTEQAAVSSTVQAYNAYIAAKADSLGWAYFDPNSALTLLRAMGAIPAHPNLADATNPFGTYISLDGIHPRLPAHKLIASTLIGIINGKYNTKLNPVP